MKRTKTSTKKKKQTLKLLVMPIKAQPFKNWPFKWATDKEILELKKDGWIRVKDV